MTKRASSKPASSPTPNTDAMMTHDAARQVADAQSFAWQRGRGDGNTSEKVSQTMPQTAGTWVTLETHFEREPAAHEQHERGQPVEHPGQPLPLHLRIDHHEAEMGDVGGRAVEFEGASPTAR